MRISTLVSDPDAERDKLKKFQENEKKRYRAEQQRFELKHARQLEEMRASSDATIKELEQLQNEKRKMLMEHESIKLKEQEETYTKELREWKALLKPRKQVCLELLYDVSTHTDQREYTTITHDNVLTNVNFQFSFPLSFASVVLLAYLEIEIRLYWFESMLNYAKCSFIKAMLTKIGKTKKTSI